MREPTDNHSIGSAPSSESDAHGSQGHSSGGALARGVQQRERSARRFGERKFSTRPQTVTAFVTLSTSSDIDIRITSSMISFVPWNRALCVPRGARNAERSEVVRHCGALGSPLVYRLQDRSATPIIHNERVHEVSHGWHPPSRTP